MYNVTLVNLASDARAVARDHGRVEHQGLRGDEVRELFQRFREIDPVENAGADAEIRVQSPAGSWVLRAGQRNLILYDAVNREAPGHAVSPEEAIAEIDGSATAARVERLTAAPFVLEAEPEPPPPSAPPASRRRRIALSAAAVILGAAVTALRVSASRDEPPAEFQRLPAADAQAAWASLAGVYLTGTQPGQHGLVLTATGEARLFEFRAVDAPRVVQASAVPGRMGGQLCLATDQPGGIIGVRDGATLVYCGETYARLP